MVASIWMLLLAIGLVAGGAALLARPMAAQRRALAERIELVAAQGATAPPVERKVRDGFFIADTRAATARDVELLAFARICRRFGVAPRNVKRAFSIVQATTAGLAAAVVYVGLEASQLAGAGVAIFVIVGGVAGYLAPILVLRRAASERQRAVTRGFADALELLVVCAEAGLALEDALARVTQELQVSQPALAEELAMTSADMQVLPDRNQAFTNLAERVDVPTISSVISTLSQTLRYGTPLAGALRVAAAELRSDSILELEERAGRLPALMSIPLMIFILPTILLIVSGPAILRVLDILASGN